MTGHVDILDQHESLKKAFTGAICLHAALIGGLVGYQLWQGHTTPFGSQNAGGAIGVEVAKSIPLVHHGMNNPLANQSESEIPQTPLKEKDRVKEKPAPKDAIALKTKAKKRPPPEEVASAKQRFRPFEELDQNQLTTRTAPAVSNPLYSKQGGGQVGAGENTALGGRCAAYATQIQQLVAQKWQTGDVDARITSAPVVIADFDLSRNGSVHNLGILQRSGIATLDYSVQRAIQDASPFPPIPPCFDKDTAKVEFTFELKR